MNTENFRKDLRMAMEAQSVTQSELSRMSGVEQYNISKFLNGDRDILLSNAMKLWPFVYGDRCPHQSPHIEPSHAPQA